MIEDVLSSLTDVRRNGAGWSAKCPAHDDRRSSLSVTASGDGTVLVKCHAGCSFDQIVNAASLTPADFFVTRTTGGNGQSPGGRIAATYDYVDEDGALVLQVCRMQPKDFRQRRPNGNGGWIWNSKGVQRVLYRLPDLLRSPQDAWVFIVEGEKDVDRLAGLGLTATTCLMGAGKWRSSYNKHLRGRRIAVIGDNDEPGRQHAQQVAQSVVETATEVRVVELADLPEKGDVSDWMDNGHNTDELLALIDAAASYEPQGQTVVAESRSDEPHATDLGNARRFAKQHGENVRYVHTWGKWLAWDGRRWATDESGAVERLAKATVEKLFTDAVALSDPKLRNAALEHAMASESASRIAALLRLAQSEPGIAITSDEFDSDPLLLNTPSGTIDLKAGDMREHHREDYCTRLAMRYRPPGGQGRRECMFGSEAPCPRWDQFLDEIFERSIALTTYVRRMAGYTLTGLVDEHVLFFLHGSGANGKSTFLNVLLALLGDYAVTTAPGLLIRKGSEEHPTGLADLFGARFVSSVETGENRRLDEEKVKWITGGDLIKARRMREDFWEFQPSHKLFLASNHKPVIRGTDVGIWRRLHLVPFTVEFPPERQDHTLTRTLLDELPGIMAWALAGCGEWQERGLDLPPEVVQATQEYRVEMDLLAQWLSDACVIGADHSASAKGLHDNYVAYTGHKVSQQWLGHRLRENGFRKVKGRTVQWHGLGLAGTTLAEHWENSA